MDRTEARRAGAARGRPIWLAYPRPRQAPTAPAFTIAGGMDQAGVARQVVGSHADIYGGAGGQGWTPATPSPAAADTKHLEDQLGQRLGSPVRLEWPDAPGTRALIIGYSDMETLKGVLQELARGPEGTGHLGSAMRSLRIEIADADELDALTGHLLGE